jgi:predicted metal-dependent HD superfamily phosphohydrolase
MAVEPHLSPWPLPQALGLRDRLVAAYGEPGRGYHDTLHLAEVLGHLTELHGAGERFDLDLAVLAAWFHDAVYDGKPDPEDRSARWAEDVLARAGLPAEDAAEVARLVRMTADHRPEPGDGNGEALSDADLAILAADDARYRDYVAGVRAEYAHVPDDLFREGRAAILADLAAKGHLFHTAYAREHWESRARANLARELAGLR